MSGLRRFLGSSSYQVGLLFAAPMLLGVFFVSYWLVIASDDTLLRESEEAVRAEIRAFRVADEHGGISSITGLLDTRLSESPNHFFYALQTASGELIGGNLPAWPESEVKRLKEGLLLIEVEHELLPGEPKSVRSGSEHFDIMAKVHTLSDGSQLLVGRDIDDLEIAQFVAGTFGWIMILILIGIFALSCGVAYYVASRFQRMARTAETIIETGNLSERLPVDSTWDDLSKLSSLLNRMLAELEWRVDGIKTVSDNIAHDLRTPLMRLRALIESETTGTARERLLTDLESTLSIFNSLLRISSIEAGKQALKLTSVDVKAICEDAVALYEPVAEDKSVSLLLEGEAATALADRDLLFQAVANLIDNAIKFTPPGGAVRCSCDLSDNRVSICISDDGPGIPEKDRAHVLQRFSRLDQSRSTEGNGLGLPLVLAIVKRHQGELSISSTREDPTAPGLCVTMELPARIAANDAP